MYMIAKIISAITKFLDDVFKNMRCYSRCCEVNECSCSNVEDQQQDEDIQVVISESLHQHHQHHSHTPENNDDELERGA